MAFCERSIIGDDDRMASPISITHTTRYRYAGAVYLGTQILRLRPMPHNRTPIDSYALTVSPTPQTLRWSYDEWGNPIARVTFDAPVTEMTLNVGFRADLTPINPFDFLLDPSALTWPFQYEPAAAKALASYRGDGGVQPRLARLAEPLRRQFDQKDTVSLVIAAGDAVRAAVRYITRAEPGVLDPDQTLARGEGSCRDSGWLLVALLRELGLAARFVSGYLIEQLTDGATRAELHAWAEAFLPGAGWVGIDPTSGLLVNAGHVPLAAGAAPGDAAPVVGTLSSAFQTPYNPAARNTLDFSFTVTPAVPGVAAQPPPTRHSQIDPPTLDAVGAAVDAALSAGDVRLTMGAEPTFVAADDLYSTEWQTAALGPTKRARGTMLIRKLRAHFAPQGLLHFGQGKWYPGEFQPRWALGCFWRKDGEPLWRAVELIDEAPKTAPTIDDARRLIEAIADQLRLDHRCVIPGYDDAWYTGWLEKKLPRNVDPDAAYLKSDTVIGFTLPLKPETAGDALRWRTSLWHFRRGRMELGTGNAPMGYRLPLDRLEWVDPAEYPYFHDRDPSDPRGPLPETISILSDAIEPPADPAKTGESAKWLVRTALCVEPRGGGLYIFLPPMERLEEAVALLAAVEAAVVSIGIPVALEGYAPPDDPRMNTLRVTPDPGVLEVNLHPAADWKTLSENLAVVYETAAACGLIASKYNWDGRPQGTGGGCHILLGGALPADSPVLRRADLLRSLITFWHNHPSLSYLFAGQFIGPTSQSPRVDQARGDQVYELELALSQLPRADTCPPWQVDRVLRNILVDLTGNTHRAEFCIDKLFAPENVTGRLGLLELRALEMPATLEMNRALHLLIRALVAQFWQKPYERPLIRWGNQIHDRFLLPHFIWNDFAEVVAESNAGGFAVQLDWFAPQRDFRFPALGRIAAGGVSIDLRAALEPWPVLGEAPSGGGVSRPTDSSLQRIEVLAGGFDPNRHRLTCNGVRVPLSGVSNGRWVAGIRFRAWPAPTGLHPMIAPHVPLRLELIDIALNQVIGGTIYHVTDPMGKLYDGLPKNAEDARRRIDARVLPLATTDLSKGAAAHREPKMAEESPLTLDLRANSG